MDFEQLVEISKLYADQEERLMNMEEKLKIYKYAFMSIDATLASILQFLNDTNKSSVSVPNLTKVMSDIFEEELSNEQ